MSKNTEQKHTIHNGRPEQLQLGQGARNDQIRELGWTQSEKHKIKN